jgi:16S rRNA (guanine527-N7)-methyltransferase
MELLREGMRALGLELSARQEGQFRRYQEGLALWNQRVNLTSKAALADVERVHFLDSLALVPILQHEMPAAARLVDVGAGAGFPGVPVKLLMPWLQLTLVEATARKADFLKWLVGELELKEVEVVAQRAEQLAHQPGLREAFDVATARALGLLPTVLELTLPFCRVGGLVAAQRAGEVAGEVAAATAVAQALGGRLRSPLPVLVPGLRKDVAVVLTDKVSVTSSRYPRRTGMPAHRPLTAK